MPTVVAPDIVIAPNLPAPVGFTVWHGRPVIIATNGQGVNLGVASGEVAVRAVDAYGVPSGAAVTVQPGAPTALSASDRRIVACTSGPASSGAPLVFT